MQQDVGEAQRPGWWVNRAFCIEMYRHTWNKGTYLRECHMIDSTDLCIWYDNFLEIAEDHLVPTKWGYYDNFLTDERKLSWGRVSYSNLLRGKNGSSVGSERQHQKMSQLSPSTMSGAEWNQAARRTFIPLEYGMWSGLMTHKLGFSLSLVRTVHWQLPVNWQLKIIWKKWDLPRLWDLLKSIALSARSIHKTL